MCARLLRRLHPSASAGPYVTSPQWHRQLVCIPHEQATMRTNVRSGRRGCPRGQRVGALLSNLLIAGMHTCCAPFAPLAGKSPSRHVTRAPSATDWIAPWMQHLLECPEQTVAVSNNAESRVSIQTTSATPRNCRGWPIRPGRAVSKVGRKIASHSRCSRR
jgi:hypothetical protein